VASELSDFKTQNNRQIQGCHTFLIFLTETNHKPNRSDATKLSYVVFFVLEVTAALDTAKISSSVMVKETA